MPITLGPLSRRGFLRGSVAGVTAALLPRWARAFTPDAAVDPHRIILLSDIHLDANRNFAKSNTNVWNNLQQAIGEILATPTRPAMVLINGDLAHDKGTPEDYATVVAALEPLRKAGLTLHLSMGNHDDRGNFWRGLPADDARKNGLDDRQVCIIETPRANILMLDSLNVTAAAPGLLGKKQLTWLGKSLDARADKPAIVFVHHDPDPRTPEEKKDPKKKGGSLTDTPAFFDVILPRKQVKACVFGHTHDWHHLERDGVQFVNLPPTAWLFKAGRPRGWVDMNLGENGATFELHSLDTTHPQHGEKLDLKWR